MRASRRIRRIGIVAAVVSMALAAGIVPAAGSEAGQLAQYQGRMIDMSVDWEGAQACHVTEDGAWCFDSEAEMNRWVAKNQGNQSLISGPIMMASYCSGSVKLYDGTSYSGASLSLTLRSQWLNLSNYGFDQRTSSFKIGPCAATFADWANGGGSLYPSYLTQAYDQSTSMISGWNNDVSSIYIS